MSARRGQHLLITRPLKKQAEIEQVRALMKAGTLSQTVAQAAVAHAEEGLRTLNEAAPAREEKQTAKILRMLPRTAEAMRARLWYEHRGVSQAVGAGTAVAHCLFSSPLTCAFLSLLGSTLCLSV